MTKLEAIEMLSELRDGYNFFDDSEQPFYEALSMAIKALSCSEEPNRSDLISRQDAIDALWEQRQKLNDHMEILLQNDNMASRYLAKIERNRIEEDINIIEELLSAQPEKSTTEEKSQLAEENSTCDLISRQDAIDAIAKILSDREGGNAVWWKPVAESVIDILPSAQPERKRGKWLVNNRNGTFKIYDCSECGWSFEAEWNFCPNCGADMR